MSYTLEHEDFVPIENYVGDSWSWNEGKVVEPLG